MTALTPVQIVYNRIASTLDSLGISGSVRDIDTDPRGTGQTFVTVRPVPQELARSRFHSDLKQRVGLNIYADADRDSSGTATVSNAESKVYDLFKKLDPLLDFTGPTPDVISCERVGNPQTWPIEDDSHAVFLVATYEVRL